jgi:hypothetical protein
VTWSSFPSLDLIFGRYRSVLGDPFLAARYCRKDKKEPIPHFRLESHEEGSRGHDEDDTHPCTLRLVDFPSLNNPQNKIVKMKFCENMKLKCWKIIIIIIP